MKRRRGEEAVETGEAEAEFAGQPDGLAQLAQLEAQLEGLPESQASSPTEELLATGRIHYMLRDDDLRKLIYEKYPHFLPVYLACSHLVKTSFLDQLDFDVLRWRIKEMIDLVLATKRDLKVDDVIVAYALYVHTYSTLKDALEGWRGRLVTEQVRVHRVEGEVERDKRRWWERIFGR